MSNVQNFVQKYYPFAKQTEAKSGIIALAIMAQAAHESGWGKVAPGNMFFGVKDTDGFNGNEQLLTTTEYLPTPSKKFPVVLSVQEVIMRGRRMFKYKIKDWFRKYKTPEESFTDHATFFLRNKRYSEAIKHKHDAYRFLSEVAKAGYATDPDYERKLHSIARMIEPVAKTIA